MENLRPCPFCGGEAHLKFITVDYPFTNTDLYYTVQCEKCGQKRGHYSISQLPRFCPVEDKKAKGDATENWNRRATDADRN